ncbi:hypothetical protein F0562_005069 [Nyssa sinensis]|uniref:NAC domain-containing protein n=1 Tax=Nyssa sinensis TaxID=561372 RepID=A0A5J5AJP9_9ASTE|nr:hypothetical protein F0562_005069 [Nyssa sinensis]
MDERNDADKIDDVILPGYRFHPTDEELVGFYLKRKIQQRPLPIELIKQVDIYKYDPWDLPRVVNTGTVHGQTVSQELGFGRPLELTGQYTPPNGTKCVGLKKSLVFYKGRAAKGTKTDWMMHEFRLPSISDSAPPKKLLDKNPSCKSEIGKTSESIDFEGPQQQFNSFSSSSPQDLQGNIEEIGLRKNQSATHGNNQWENVRSIGFPFSLPSSQPDEWNPNLPWNSPSCPSEMSTTYSTNKCYN